MSGKKTFGGLAVASLVVWGIAAAGRPQQSAPAEPTPAPPPPPAPPEQSTPARRAGFRRRLATSLALAAVFFAGAALAAGAGNELVSVDAGSTDAALLTDATTDVTATSTYVASTDATTTAEDVTTTTTEDVATDPVATAPVTADPVTTDPVTTDPVATGPVTTDPATTDAAASAAEPDPSDATPAPPQPETDVAVRPAAAVAAAPEQLPAPRPVRAPRLDTQSRAAVQSPFPVVPFDPQAWLADHPGTALGNAAVAIAEGYLGVAYRWGGNSPAGGFDCSGLTQYVYAQLGIWLPHYAAAQFLMYPRLDPSQLEPGDLVFFEPKADGPGHVAIYAGDGEILEAPHTGAVVRVGSLAGAAASMGFLGAVRPSAGEPTRQTFAVAAQPRVIEGRFVAE